MGEKKRTRRHLGAEEKLKILAEARQPSTTVAEVLRRHLLDATTFYRWEREAKAAMLAALGDQRRARADTKDHEIERLNEERLHAGLGYFPPAEFYMGNPMARISERQARLENAKQARQRINIERLQEAA